VGVEVPDQVFLGRAAPGCLQEAELVAARASLEVGGMVGEIDQAIGAGSAKPLISDWRRRGADQGRAAARET
jgi:hypothetical protein